MYLSRQHSPSTGKSFVFPSLDFDPCSQVCSFLCLPHLRYNVDISRSTLGMWIKIQGWEHETFSCAVAVHFYGQWDARPSQFLALVIVSSMLPSLSCKGCCLNCCTSFTYGGRVVYLSLTMVGRVNGDKIPDTLEIK